MIYARNTGFARFGLDDSRSELLGNLEVTRSESPADGTAVSLE
jgi:hypothetical protein